ncbi:MAG: hypothetical protein IPJ65_15705 [Archangiaceae bacterium]|nr:hypothetical protein [Archangiaceae bacterium]
MRTPTALLAVFLAGCGSTPPESGTGGGTATAGGDGSAGGAAGGTAGGTAGGAAGGSAGGTAGGAPQCAPETDAAFCARKNRTCESLTAFDNCGASRTVNCGSCAPGQTCGSTGNCCAAESDATFCARLQKSCGTFSGTDSCGLNRTANCGACFGQQTCGGSGTPNVCGQNLCSACISPPANRCDAPTLSTGYFKATAYDPTGTCTNPATGACSYTSHVSACDEDCRIGFCVQTPCSLSGTQCSTPHTGCKLTTSGDLRCLVVDTGGTEGVPCDDEVPGYRCDARLRCVRPTFATTAICAWLCISNTDCNSVGLQGLHACVKTAGETYGWCR